MEPNAKLLLLSIVAAVMIQVSWVCTTVFLHRGGAHKALSLHLAVSNLMHFWITFLTGVNASIWIAVHRKHHHLPDQEDDPHSPYIRGRAYILFFTIVLYYKEGLNPSLRTQFAPDYIPDSVDKLPRWLTHRGIFSAVLFTLVGGLIDGSAGLGYGLWLWSVHLLGYLFTFSSVNSFGHEVKGESSEERKAHRAKNAPQLALFSWGEWRHKDHHDHPGSANFGRGDFGWWLIAALRSLGLASIKKAAE